MSTSTSTSTTPATGVLTPVRPAALVSESTDLSKRILSAVAAHRVVAYSIDPKTISVPGHVGVRLVWEYGIFTVEVLDPDLGTDVADYLGLVPQGHLDHTIPQRTWRGTVADQPVILVARGRTAADLTPETARRIIADIEAEQTYAAEIRRDGTLVDVTL